MNNIQKLKFLISQREYSAAIKLLRDNIENWDVEDFAFYLKFLSTLYSFNSSDYDPGDDDTLDDLKHIFTVVSCNESLGDLTDVEETQAKSKKAYYS